MEKIVGVKSVKQEVLTKEYLDERKRIAFAAIDKLEAKPTLESMLKSVDAIWEKHGKVQLVFENKDQHYAYVTTLFHDVIEPMSLDEYKAYLKKSVEQRLDGVVGLMEKNKIMEAAKLNKEYINKYTADKLEEGLNDLKERNSKITSAIKEEIAKDAQKH